MDTDRRQGGSVAPLILVTGATGNQGGAVVDALLTAGSWRVRALTRDPASPKARALAARGVEVVAGDMADQASLRPALAGAAGVFSVQNSRTAGLDGEVRQGTTLVDAAQAEGVDHFVYTSVGGAERVRGIPHFDTKWQIEEHLRASSLRWTILRPTTFMDVFTMRGAGVGLSLMGAALGTTRTLQMVAVRDIGIFAQLAFAAPDEYSGRAIELAGDELTVPAIAATVRASGRRVRHVRLPRGVVRLLGREGRMFTWFAESGYAADIAHLRAVHPGLLTLEAWLRTGLGGTAATTADDGMGARRAEHRVDG